MQVEGPGTTVTDYSNELEIINLKYKQLETRNHELEKSIIDYQKKYFELKEYENKYILLKEQYDLLIYKRFGRSAEQLLADEKQLRLFIEGAADSTESEKIEPEEFQKVKSYQRRNCGRKPLSPTLSRRERIIDIEEKGALI
jgi:hypothetical protein